MTYFLKSKLAKFTAKFVKYNQNMIEIIQFLTYKVVQSTLCWFQFRQASDGKFDIFTVTVS